MDEETIKKNILDLYFQKNLNIASTSVIVAFTYLIGVGIAVVTGQINLDNFVNMAVIFIISSGILGICSTLFFKATFHLKEIPRILKGI